MHTLTDGRDCEDGTSIPLMDTLQKDLKALEKQGVDARVASGGGRMCTTMDRYEVCVPLKSYHTLRLVRNKPIMATIGDFDLCLLEFQSPRQTGGFPLICQLQSHQAACCTSTGSGLIQVIK